MSFRFRSLTGSLELGGGRGSRRRRGGARWALSDHASNPMSIDRLRILALDEGLDPAGLRDSELVDALANRIEDGRLEMREKLRGSTSGAFLAIEAGGDDRAQDDDGTKILVDWIRIKLIDQKGRPVAGESYEIVLPDGLSRSGRLDDEGRAEHRGIPSGECDVTFPRLSKKLWGKSA